MINLDGETIEQEVIEDVKVKKKSPFDYVNAIHYTKENLCDDEIGEKQYNPFIVNKALSFGADTVIYANEMNSRSHLEKRLQFDFLINITRPRKRFNKWIKAEKVENIELVKEYYNYNTEKALEAMKNLTADNLEYIRKKMNKGGR